MGMDVPVNTFLKVLDSADTSVGGGSASAIAGAMAAALVAMVARLSIGREGMREEAFYRDILDEAERLSGELSRGALDDEQAFAAVRAAYRLPKDTAAEKAQRREVIQEAMLQATRVPLCNAERCQRVFAQCVALGGCSNRSAAADLECARHLARAGVLSAVANVFANVPAIRDETVTAELKARAQVLRTAVG